MAMGLLWSGFSDCQKPTVRVSSLTVKMREFQSVRFGGGEEIIDVFSVVICEEMLVNCGVDVVELGCLDEERRDGEGAAGDELQTAERSGGDGAAAGPVVSLQSLPARSRGQEGEPLSRSKSQTEAMGWTRVIPLIMVIAKCRFDCIVWSF